MHEAEIEALKRRIFELRVEHRDLDQVIAGLMKNGYPDELQLRRLKKRKLLLKDLLAKLESQLVPDVRA